jgi:hypothetical protein
MRLAMLGSISKQGDRDLRSLFTADALAVIATPRSMAQAIDLGSPLVSAAADQGRTRQS